MGWSWSLCFAQAAMSQAVERALRSEPMPRDHKGVRGGLVQDGRPSPYIGPGFAICSVYVDNATVLAASPSDCAQALKNIEAELGRVGLIVGDSDPPADSMVTLGYLADMPKRRVSHKPEKAWAIYRGCRYLRQGG